MQSRLRVESNRHILQLSNTPNPSYIHAQHLSLYAELIQIFLKTFLLHAKHIQAYYKHFYYMLNKFQYMLNKLNKYFITSNFSHMRNIYVRIKKRFS